MDESAVFGHVIDELETRDYQPLVHMPGSHQDTYANVLDRCETHQITIGGRYPDVLGFTHADRVFAVEVKGSSGLLRGIGQALTYQQGAHVSYLAAATDTVSQHADLLRSKGVGVIGATDNGVTRWSSPPTSESHEQVVYIEGQLSVRLRRSDISGDIASLSLAQPLNYLAPVVAVDQHGPLAGDELTDILEAEYGFGAGTQARRSALSLGLLEGTDRFALTDQGELAATVLRGYGISTLQNSMRSKMRSVVRRSSRNTSRSLFCFGTATSDTPNSGCCSTRCGKRGRRFTFPIWFVGWFTSTRTSS
jgi:hypothetical protein